MSESERAVNRRSFLERSLATGSAAGLMLGTGLARAEEQPPQAAPAPAPAEPAKQLPFGMIGKAKISRVLLGGNLIGGWMHARDLKYVGSLFRAYATEEKIIQTLAVAEQNGINTVFETGADYIAKYNREHGGKMQFIPHIEVSSGQSETTLKEHIQKQVDSGAVALYVWGVSADRLIQAGDVAQLAKAVELAKKHDLPVGVGSHSLLVTKACEEHNIPCDYYVKTFHNDDYPSATPKDKRKEFIWLDGGEGWYDNMWCINPQETAQFMQTVKKPWVAFKVLAAGAYLPRQGFDFAFENGADFIAVGMFDFHIAENCELAAKVLRRQQNRARPWMA